MGAIFNSGLLLLFLSASVAAQSLYLVKEGDNLSVISQRTGVSVEAIKSANGLSSDVIWEGSRLIIPAKEERVSPVPEQMPVAPKPTRIEGGTARSSRTNTLSEKGMTILQLQVTLDRAGFSPGILDGYDGKYTRLAKTLCEAWNPAALQANLPAIRTVSVPASWKNYVDLSLPGTGAQPDFRELTRNKRVIRYYTILEYLAERYHCSEGLLRKLNPHLDFKSIKAGTPLVVPNVDPFLIENYFTEEGEGRWSSALGKGGEQRMIYISAEDMMLTVWDADRMIRSYPITLNEKDSPRGRRELGTITPGPPYMRKKTKLELLGGPNSPVGIIWCPLGNGFGIHGTNDPKTIGRASSSGCVRLANWDVVRLAKLVRKGTPVMTSVGEQDYVPKD